MKKYILFAMFMVIISGCAKIQTYNDVQERCFPDDEVKVIPIVIVNF